MTKAFLNRSEAAEYVRAIGLPCSKLTLEKLASVGGGPEFQKFGNRVVYTAAALNRWVERKLSEPRASTSEAA
jgi:hypothetical protein